ncbi:MAG: thiamine pyrophosphate-dependent enzyme [Desulfatiglans sp.]|jgi:indolepyruvate ferredoxin oxidoreductase alpha subunit|nr:thiamine pyrophosphate-dependent enzyme [Desulfatiglans sp.]
MSIEDLRNGEAGTELLVLGNEAVARGALEAGVWVAACYPGTPSSEISDTLAELSKTCDFDFEYSVNEKVAADVAATAGVFGGKGMMIFKAAGFLVASDTLFHLGVTGISGSLVIMACDDPSAHSSGDEFDIRPLGQDASLFTFVPANPQEAKDMTVDAFKVSEQIELAAMVRMSTRVCHQKGFITLGEIPKEGRKEIDWDYMQANRMKYLIAGGPFVRMGKARMLKGIAEAKKISEESKFNEFVDAGSDVGILTCGVTHGYALEAIKNLGIDASIFKVGVSFPLPEKRLKKFFKAIKKLIVVEETAPYLELHAKAIAKEVNPGLEIFGRDSGHFPMVGECDPTLVIKALARVLRINPPVDYVAKQEKVKDLANLAFPRMPVLCSGCPHRSTYYVMKKATKGSALFTMDVGCYGLGSLPPFNLGNINFCMGTSLGTASGLNYICDKPVVATIGDSTFFHAGLPGLVNAVFNQSNFTLVVLDNGATGMTGFQPNPGVGIRSSGKPGKRVVIEDIARGMGVEDVRVVNSFNVKELLKACKEAIAFHGVSVLVSRGECSQISMGKKDSFVKYVVDTEKCDGCWHCIESFGCPAIEKDKDVAVIIAESCDGCSVCAQICPFDAIMKGD